MSIAWLLYVLAVGMLLAAAAVAVGAALRALRAPQRWAYALALAATATLATVAPARARSPVAVQLPVAVTVGGTTAQPQPAGLAQWLQASRDRLERSADHLTARAESAIGRNARRAALGAWAAASLGMLALFVVVHARLLLARRRWPAMRVHEQSVRVAPRTGPAVIGLARAEIVVPRSLLDRSADEQRLILAHEREHLRARDHLLLAGGWAIAIALPWHPAAWLLLDRLRLAIELDCDARVLRAGVGARSYGSLLIDMAAQASGIRMGALALADGPSHLERRILAMNTIRMRHATTYSVLVGTVGLALMLVACEARVPTSAEIAQMDVAEARRSAAKAGMVRTPLDRDVDYFVNGVKSTAAAANAIDGRSIGSIEVVKSERANGRDTIFVTTLDRMPNAASAEWQRLPAKMLDANQPESRELPSPLRVRDELPPMVRSVADPVRSKQVAVSQSRPRSRLALPDGSHPVFLLDGRKVTADEIAAVPESEIRSVSVFKKDGTGIDQDAANGVVSIETRGKQTP